MNGDIGANYQNDHSIFFEISMAARYCCHCFNCNLLISYSSFYFYPISRFSVNHCYDCRWNTILSNDSIKVNQG